MDLLKHECFGRMNFQKRHRNLCVINMFICVSKKQNKKKPLQGEKMMTEFSFWGKLSI